MPNSESTAEMAAAALAFLTALDDGQRAMATAPFDDDHEAGRRDWHYIPRRRAGVAFADLSSSQEKAAYDLLATGLGVGAHAAAVTVVALEDVLDRKERGRGPRRGRPPHWGRHRADYSTTVFGDPKGPTWGWRFEGHHVSVNVTIVDGELAATPCFLGANPAEVRTDAGIPVTRPLAAEEDLALALLAALDGRQRDAAMLPYDAPDDILTEAAPTLDDLPELAGVRLADLGPTALTAARRLVAQYLDRLPPALGERRAAQLQADLGDLRFAFAGVAAHRRPQYYRLAGVPTFFVEYDNTQDDANHVHTVLRDPSGDFGIDLLRAHRAGDH